MTLIAPRRNEPIVEKLGTPTRRMIEYLELNSAEVNKKVVLEISDWNMSTTTNVDVPHGVTYGDIISAKVFIRNDADTAKDSINTGVSAVNATPQGYVGTTDSTNINIVRLTGGKFDHADYSTTSYNRGWIVVTLK